MHQAQNVPQLSAGLAGGGVMSVNGSELVGGIADLLETLNYRPDEFVAVARQAPGVEFATAVMPPEKAPEYVAALGDTVNVWYGVNPTEGPERAHNGRGTEEQATRLSALYADLDVKPGACPDLDVAETIIDDLSALLGTRPSAVVFSGHGLQPYWPIDDGAITDTFNTADAKSLSARFRRLVDVVAEARGVEKIDNVADLARVLRTPNTVNIKSDPVRATVRTETGGPLRVAEVDERLTEQGIDRQPDDTSSAEMISDPDGWTFGARTCSYVTKLVTGLVADGPRVSGGPRNPWACSQAVRLCCAWRLGCITENDFVHAGNLLEARLTALLSTEPRRRLRTYEMRDVMRLGRKRAAAKTDEQARAELGSHDHGGTAEDYWGTGSDNGAGGQDTSAHFRTTWEPIDLGPYLRGEVTVPQPSLGMARSDGQRMIYPGCEHAVLGETESGKTWFALGCVAAELTAGHRVVYIHYEEPDPASTIERLGLLGVGPDAITGQLAFIAPQFPLMAGWLDPLLDPPPTLVIHDGVNEAMALHGAVIKDVEGASLFRRTLVTPFLKVGAASVACDHLPMARDPSRRDAYGSVHKGNALTGARIVLENVEPFGKAMRGVSHMYITKDRPGELRAHGRATNTPGKTYFGTFVIDDMIAGPDFMMRLLGTQTGRGTGGHGQWHHASRGAVRDRQATRPHSWLAAGAVRRDT